VNAGDVAGSLEHFEPVVDRISREVCPVDECPLRRPPLFELVENLLVCRPQILGIHRFADLWSSHSHITEPRTRRARHRSRGRKRDAQTSGRHPTGADRRPRGPPRHKRPDPQGPREERHPGETRRRGGKGDRPLGQREGCQVEATLEEDTPGNEPERTQLPGDIKPATSPLDFFANCRQHKVKQRFVDERSEQNTYRALLVATRWEEFATKRTTGDGVFFSRDDVRQALTAIMGEQPHGTTITRVWESMKQLGGSDLEERTRRVSPTQPTKEILAMDLETATGLLEDRYCHLDLLEEGTAGMGGVTPVVTQPTVEAV
jgi:hypothetical protein